ncbi:MAG: hypothetical protein K1X88_19145, partial [Nannocystaceae bacterium]|nr:hypothetical protein [Nannocystaceae bacterium]
MTPPTSRPLARASEHMAAGRFAEAAGAFRAVLQIDASEPQAHEGLGHCARARGHNGDAFEHFVRAAGLWRERGEDETALGCYTQAVASDPSQLDVHVDIAELEAAMGRTEQARMRLEGLAENYLAGGRTDDAAAILEFVNQWDDEPAAPTPVAATVSEPHTIIAPPIGVQVVRELETGAPAPVRDVEGTMVIQTFLLMPDGRPFLPGMAPPPAPVLETRPKTLVPTEAPSDTPAMPPRAAAGLDDEEATALEQIDETSLDDFDATASRPAVTSVHEDEGLIGDDELDGIELPPSPDDDRVAASREEEPDATTVRPSQPRPAPRPAAPPSVDAQGRSLAERLRSTRARTGPVATVPAASTGARAGASVVKPGASKPAATPSKPAARPSTTASASTSTPAKPAARPAAAATASAATKPAARPSTAPTTAGSRPATASSKPATAPAAATPRPAANTPTRASASPRPTAVASRPN